MTGTKMFMEIIEEEIKYVKTTIEDVRNEIELRKTIFRRSLNNPLLINEDIRGRAIFMRFFINELGNLVEE